MSKIETLVPDIYALFSKGGLRVDKETAEQFGHDMAGMLVSRLSEDRDAPRVRLSNVGKPCARQLWYTINAPELAEELTPDVRIKFLFGDVIESLVMFLAKLAGHEVADQQKEVEVSGVKGRIDGTIDGVLVDVKSASKFSFNKFAAGLKREDDGFGYLVQLGSYAAGSNAERGAFLAVGKEQGKLVLDVHDDLPNKNELEKLVQERKDVVALPVPPARAFTDEPDGASGNRKLKFNCSYCPFKKACWPGLRLFLYAQKPVFLTVVNRLPKVDEIKDF